MTKTQDAVITPDQCRMARTALHWTIDDLVAASDVGRNTIARFERGDNIKASTAAKVRAAFEAHRIRFIDDGPFAGGLFRMRAGC